MPIKLNPCRICGLTELTVSIDENGRCWVECNACGNCECGASDRIARQEWNAVNPKEGTPNE